MHYIQSLVTFLVSDRQTRYTFQRFPQSWHVAYVTVTVPLRETRTKNKTTQPTMGISTSPIYNRANNGFHLLPSDTVCTNELCPPHLAHDIRELLCVLILNPFLCLDKQQTIQGKQAAFKLVFHAPFAVVLYLIFLSIPMFNINCELLRIF